MEGKGTQERAGELGSMNHCSWSQCRSSSGIPVKWN